jgi:putative transposase
MATFRRALVPGATYFFTVNTYLRQKVLTFPPFLQAIREEFGRVKMEHPFTIDAFVLLPDHLHCVWTLPQGDIDYALRWSLIKRRVSQATKHLIEPQVSRSRQQRHELGLWQRRFWEHQIRDEEDFIKHVDYIHWNPVKHGYTSHVRDWTYSSFHQYVKRRIYPRDWASGPALQDFDDKYGELE